MCDQCWETKVKKRDVATGFSNQEDESSSQEAE